MHALYRAAALVLLALSVTGCASPANRAQKETELGLTESVITHDLELRNQVWTPDTELTGPIALAADSKEVTLTVSQYRDSWQDTQGLHFVGAGGFGRDAYRLFRLLFAHAEVETATVQLEMPTRDVYGNKNVELAGSVTWSRRTFERVNPEGFAGEEMVLLIADNYQFYPPWEPLDELPEVPGVE